MSAAYRVSVVVPTYKRRECIQRLLRALTRQTLPAAEFEVIVSIDGSDDGTREMVGWFSAPYCLQVLWHPHRGRAAACNAGIRAAQGELVVLLDDDMEPVPGFLTAHESAHRAGPRLGVLGAVPIPISYDSSPIVRYIGGKFNRHLEILGQPGYKFKLRDFYSGNFSIRRTILMEAGAFDEAFTIYGHEDLDLFRRLTQARVWVVYNAEALAYQHYTKNFLALVQDNMDKGRTAILLASKDPEVFAESRLNSYRQWSLRWRLARSLLLGMSNIWRGMPDSAMAFMSWLERWSPANFVRLCPAALDYFFWLGVRSALRENWKSRPARWADPFRR